LKDIIVIGGQNGAGKTTMASELLPGRLGLLEFVNADNIAAGLSPFHPAGDGR
jgi:predicted ABC-type ATPase